MRIRIEDSGQGFDYLAADGHAEAGGYCGRGMRLVREMCRSLRYFGCGNRVEAVYAWGARREG